MDSATPWQQAQARLFARLADDLRVLEWAAISGYPTQAMVLGASIHELGHMAAFIGQSDERAQRWLDWKNLDDLPWRAKVIYRGAHENAFNAPPGESNSLFYKLLCIAKHGNPAMTAGFEPAVTPDAHVLNLDPDVNPGAHRRVRIAIWMPTRATVIALGAMWRPRLLVGPELRLFRSVLQGWDAVDTEVRRWLRRRSAGITR